MTNCVLNVGVLGLNHKTADLSFREEIAKAASALSGERALFFPYPIVLLSTCNRTEIYFSGDDLPQAHSELLSLLRRHFDGPFEHRLYSYFGIDAFMHLSCVTAGLDSAIVAETEIQRQVKVAYQHAMHMQKLPPCLHFIFQKGLKVGKRIRRDCRLTDASLSRTIWEIADGWSSNLEREKVLFVGYSEMNRTLLRYFRSRGITDLTLATRFAAPSTEWTVVDRSVLANWETFSIVVCATKTEGYLLEKSRGGNHLIFDLSVPRNVDPALGNSGSIALYNIEQLNQLVEAKQQAGAEEIERLKDLLVDHVRRLARLYRASRLYDLARICSSK